LRKLERIRANTFARDWSAIYQQNPVPDEGEFFSADFITLRTHTHDVVSWVRGWDLSGTAQGDWTVGVMMGITKDKRTIIGDLKRMRGRPDAVAKLIEETARADTRRVRIAIARDPGQAGIAQQEFYTKLLNGYVLDFSPESGSKQGVLPFR
jgi:phage terminase large subunit-like protein